MSFKIALFYTNDHSQIILFLDQRFTCYIFFNKLLTVNSYPYFIKVKKPHYKLKHRSTFYISSKPITWGKLVELNTSNTCKSHLSPSFYAIKLGSTAL